MTRFYQNLLGQRLGLGQPLPKADALDEAKRWLRDLTAAEAGTELAALGLPVADGQKTTLRWGRNWYGSRRLGRLAARTGNVCQGDTSMTGTREDWPRRRHRLIGAFVNLGLGDVWRFADALARERGTRIVAGHFFGAPEYVRIGLGVDSATLEHGLTRIGDARGQALGRQ